MKLKILYSLISVILAVNYMTAKSLISRIDCVGQPFPRIRHMINMKFHGDTLFFVYESDGGCGQRFLRRATIDMTDHKFVVGPEIGKRSDGHYASYMPYPVIHVDEKVQVVSQDDGEIYDLVNDSVLSSTKTYLFDADVLFPISQYAQDICSVASGKYVFVGRKPNGGAQYAMFYDHDSARIDSIKPICATPTLTAWMPNIGELTYSSKAGRLAFAYRLHPVIEIFNLDGSEIKTVQVNEETFDLSTLDMADFETLNPQHFVDVSTTDKYIYALHWGHKYDESLNSTLYKLDWDGNIIERFQLEEYFSNIAVYDETIIIAWNGAELFLLSLNHQ